MVRKAKELAKAKGILSTPNPKPGEMLKYDSVKIVLEFDDDNEISRRVPGERNLHL
jgi:hypothetical protein